ncbi:MAG: CD1107 family mobile element protein [Suilimivivens sp.]
MKKSIIHVLGILTAVFFALIIKCPVYAGETTTSTGEDYIIISVDAEDENGTLLYALDTDDPSAFGSSNEFSVPAGTNHTIYVKDAAGNITSQEFQSSETGLNNTAVQENEVNERNVNIDVYLDNTASDYSDYEYSGELLKGPAESGQGTVYDKVNTTASDPEAKRIFYTLTTDEGEVFYLVIDQGESSENVYFLNKVTVSDLYALAADEQNNNSSDETESLLSSLSSASNETDEELLMQEETKEKSTGINNNSKMLIVLLVVVVGGGIYYYQNVYKKKKDEQMDLLDAPDRDDFEVEEEDEDADFGLDEDYQEQTMARLLEDDDYGQDDNDKSEQEQYATSHISDDIDTDIEQEAYEYDEDLDSPDEDEEEEEE